MKLFWKKKEKPTPVVGINSNVSKDGQWHVLMLDYDDNLKLSTLIAEISQMQKDYLLSHCHIVETSKDHYHALFLSDAISYWDCLKVIHKSSACKKFKALRMTYDYITLRISEKGSKAVPRLVAIVMSNSDRFYDYPKEVEDNIRSLQKSYLKLIEYRKEVEVYGID